MFTFTRTGFSLKRIGLAGLAAGTLAFGGAAHAATTITLQQNTDGYGGTADTMLKESTPDGNHGNRFLRTRHWTDNRHETSLIRFENLASETSSVPAGMTLDSATLSLYAYDYDNDGNATIDAYRAIKSWVEGSGGLSGGVSNGASWNWRDQDGGTPWDTGGARGYGTDVASNFTSTTEVDLVDPDGDGLDNPKYHDWDVTADVQAFLDGTEDNFGWMLEERDTEIKGPAYYSSEYTDNNPGLEPKLTMTFVPEPASAGLLALGGLALIARRRRRA